MGCGEQLDASHRGGDAEPRRGGRSPPSPAKRGRVGKGSREVSGGRLPLDETFHETAPEAEADTEAEAAGPRWRDAPVHEANALRVKEGVGRIEFSSKAVPSLLALRLAPLSLATLSL